MSEVTRAKDDTYVIELERQYARVAADPGEATRIRMLDAFIAEHSPCQIRTSASLFGTDCKHGSISRDTTSRWRVRWGVHGPSVFAPDSVNTP